MIRTLLFSTLALTATALPLSAQAPTGPVQSAAHGAVKGRRPSVRASFRVPDRQAKASLRDPPVWRGGAGQATVGGQGALELWRQRPAEVRGGLLH